MAFTPLVPVVEKQHTAAQLIVRESPLVLGSYYVNHAAHFDGLLDEVRLYGRALTPEEIRAHLPVHAPVSE
jgi:hypothetical protein